jgi:hypothetical protein
MRHYQGRPTDIGNCIYNYIQLSDTRPVMFQCINNCKYYDLPNNFYEKLLTDSIELSDSRENSSCSATKEFPNIVWNPEGSLPCSQEPSTGPYHLKVVPMLN